MQRRRKERLEFCKALKLVAVPIQSGPISHTLDTLFCGTKTVPIHSPRTIEKEEEPEMREAMAEAQEEERSDDGGIEIHHTKSTIE